MEVGAGLACHLVMLTPTHMGGIGLTFGRWQHVTCVSQSDTLQHPHRQQGTCSDSDIVAVFFNLFSCIGALLSQLL